MRILHLVPRYAPAVGGSETHMAKLSEYLVAQGHEVVVATSDSLDFTVIWRGDGRRIEQTQQTINGVEVRYFRTEHLPLSRYIYPALRRLLWGISHMGGTDVAMGLCRFTPYLPDLYRWLETTAESFDLIAAMGISFEPLFVAGQRAAQKRGIPFVAYPLTHFGAGETPGADILSRFYTMPYQTELIVRSDMLLAQTQAEADYYIGHGMERSKVTIAGPGFDPEEIPDGDAGRWREKYQIAADAPVILTMSSLNYDKGTPYLIEAVRQLWQADQDVVLAIAGNPQPDFQRYFERLPADVRSRLLMLGHITDMEKRDVLAAAQIFAMPSRTDSFGIVYLEAWYAGLPVVGAETWGVMNDVIREGENGRLVPYGDGDRLASVLGELIADPAECARLAANGRAFAVGEHTWGHKQKITADVYERLVAE